MSFVEHAPLHHLEAIKEADADLCCFMNCTVTTIGMGGGAGPCKGLPYDN
nr:hypothetical protein REQ54_03475 [Rhizobium sp. Q54]